MINGTGTHWWWYTYITILGAVWHIYKADQTNDFDPDQNLTTVSLMTFFGSQQKTKSHI